MSIAIGDPVNCPARVTLDAAQMSFFDGLPAEAPSVQSELGCELEKGHDGSHAALGQQVESTMWWVQWTLSASEVNPYTWCPAGPAPSDSAPDDGKADRAPRGEKDCALFDGHAGRHSSGKRFWPGEEAA